MQAVTEKTPIRLPLTVFIGIIAGVFGLGTSIMAARSMILSDAQGLIQQNAREREGKYITREEWLTWQRDESAKRDRQFYELRQLIADERKR